jgi:hypothetical protein
MIPKGNKAATLRAERERLCNYDNRIIWADGEQLDLGPRHPGRVAFIDRELAKLARRAERGRVYRETMYDLNGHHGRA